MDFLKVVWDFANFPLWSCCSGAVSFAKQFNVPCCMDIFICQSVHGNITKCRPFQLCLNLWIFHDGSVSEWHTVFIVNVDTARCKKDFSQQNYWLLRIQPYSHLCTSLCFWDKICEEVSFFFLTRCMWCKHYSKMQFFMKSEIQQKQAFWFCFTQLFMSLLLKWMTLRLSHNFLQNGIMCKL